jgi:hypothetical protein
MPAFGVLEAAILRAGRGKHGNQQQGRHRELHHLTCSPILAPPSLPAPATSGIGAIPAISSTTGQR